MVKHFIALKDFTKEELQEFIRVAFQIKKKPGQYRNFLKHRCIGLIFQKPSLRTKTAFYLGALELGADAIYYGPEEVKLGEREAIRDVACNFSRFMDGMVLRTFSHNTVIEFARHSSIPLINGLSDFSHPSQVLADMFTLHELGMDVRKIKVVYVGDGNNVCNSLIYALSILGGKLIVAVPKQYAPSKIVLRDAESICKKSGAEISVVYSAKEAARGADVLYTDVWTSMGREEERNKRKKAFHAFQINDGLLKLAKKSCVVMHCLPAHRGEEITDSVMDSKHTQVFLQAENRLHMAKAIFYLLLKK